MFSIFTAKDEVVSSLRSVQEEVLTIKQACKAAAKAFKDCLQLKRVESLEAMAEDSTLFKSGQQMLTKAEMIKHSDSPVKQILSKTGEVFQTMGMQQANFETTIHHILDEGKINKSTKDYFQAENEMAELKRKIGLYSNGKNRFDKEQKKLDLIKNTNDVEFEKELEARTNKAEVIYNSTRYNL